MKPDNRKIVNGRLVESYRFSPTSLRVYVDNSSVDMT